MVKYVIKKENQYVSSMDSHRFNLTDKLEKARLYTYEGHAKASITNHNWGKRDYKVQFDIAKVEISIQEVE